MESLGTVLALVTDAVKNCKMTFSYRFSVLALACTLHKVWGIYDLLLIVESIWCILGNDYMGVN